MGVGAGSFRRGPRALALVLVVAVLQWGFLTLETTPRPALAQTPGPPNVVLILTDDQRFDTLHVMPAVRRLLVAKGITLSSAIVTNPVCCPSRASILTGRYSHTTGVYTNVGENGGWPAFQASESDTIATALDAVGYRTALIGKYVNGYDGDEIYVPPGWDRWFAFAGDNGRYYNYDIFDNKRGPGFVSFGSRPWHYSTDVIRRKAVAFIRGTPEATPLFLMAAPYAPHGNFTAAPRHDGDLSAMPVRLGPGVNEADMSDKPRYLTHGSLVGETRLRTLARDQWETLLAVDEMVSGILRALRETGRASNTLFIFTSDNGILNFEHRWHGKLVPHEESIRVPMIVRFPGKIPAGSVSGALVSNVDIAPTIADFAGASLSADGVSLRQLLTGEVSSVRSSVVLEHTGVSVPTYCGVRTPSFMFAHFATGEEELYDLVQDPHQLRNVVSSRPNKAAELRALTESLCRPVPPGFSW